LPGIRLQVSVYGNCSITGNGLVGTNPGEKQVYTLAAHGSNEWKNVMGAECIKQEM